VANQADNTLSVFSALSPQSPVPGTITLDANASPQALASAPSGATVYVAYKALNSVGIVSTSSNTVVGSIPLNANGFTGSAPEVLITSTDGTKLFVGNTGSNNISIIDLTAGAVVATIGGCSHPIAMVNTTVVPYIYVVCRDSNNLLIINANTNTASYNFPVGATPVSASFDLVRRRLIVTSLGSNTVTFFDEDPSKSTAEQQAQTIVPVAGPAMAAVPLPNGSKVYVATLAGVVSVINSDTLTVTTNVAVGGSGQQIGVSSDGIRVAVTTAAPDVLQVIDTSTDTVAASHTLVGPARALLIF
jgi:YVTN family beta-propeller protein